MSSERETYLAICQTCLKSKFNRQKGLICSLTNEHACFDLNKDCPEYANDEKFTRIQHAAKKRVAAAQSDDSTAGFWRPMSVLFIILGGLIALIGFVTMLIRIKFGFSFVSLIMAVAGLVMFSKGITEFNKLARRSTQLKNRQNEAVQTDDFGDFDEII